MESQHASFVPESLHRLGFAGRTISGYDVIIPPVVDVPAGLFLMGTDKQRDPQAYEEEIPQHRMTLAAYQIGKYPLTVAEYACAVRAGAVSEPRVMSFFGPDVDWQTQLSRLDHPVINVPLPEFATYAQWLTKLTGVPWRLPTEAEWEKAARGTDGRIYPWGNLWDTTVALI